MDWGSIPGPVILWPGIFRGGGGGHGKGEENGGGDKLINYLKLKVGPKAVNNRM
jgi:hypothetical protein